MKQERIDPGWAWTRKLNISAGVKLGDTVYTSGTVAFDSEGNACTLHAYRMAYSSAPSSSSSFPVEIDDQIMLVTDTGQSIRCPVSGISFRSRGAGGVRVFNTADDERVVSVAWIADQGEDEEEGGEEGEE